MKLELEFDFAVEQARIFTIISDINQWPAELEGRILKSQPNDRLVAALPDFTRPEFQFQVLRKGTHLVLVHDLIKTEKDLASYEKAWTNWFNQLTERLSN